MQRFRLWSSRLWSAGVLIALVALGYWGHQNHWKVPAFRSFGLESAEEKAPGVKKMAPARAGYPVIEFASAKAVRHAGIACETAIERDVDLVIQANATVDYDKTKVAQLSARVSGQVWKITAALGRFVHRGDLLAIVDSPEVGQARTDFLQEHSSHHFAATRLQRLQAFAKQGAVSEGSLREAELAARETRIRRFNAQQKLLNLGLDIDLAIIEKQTPDEMSLDIQALGLSQKGPRSVAADAEDCQSDPHVCSFGWNCHANRHCRGRARHTGATSH
ncbi:MAG: efflux RND transporter periplasmic adaptor subunit [Planctomycetes bacterium]|nr:efflux RND transporter periplasmic adaptor subunit [Planctomycetota bacterium]